MNHGAQRSLLPGLRTSEEATPPGGGVVPELRSGGATEPDTVPPVRAKGRRVRDQKAPGREVAGVAAGTGRADIEAAVATSGLRIGGRVTMEGEITYLSADSGGAVWMRVQLDGGRGCFDCWATEHKRADFQGEKK